MKKGPGQQGVAQESPSPAPRLTIAVTDGTLIIDKKNQGLFSSWRIAIFGALILLIVLPLINTAEVQGPLRTFWQGLFPSAEPDRTLLAIQSGEYRNHYWSVLRFLPSGLAITFQVTVLSISVATFIGLFAGLGQISRNRLINRIATVYVEIIRGIPLVVQIFYIYYSLGQFLKLEGVLAAVLALAVCYGAYMGEIFRAGIQSIPKGQMEAALALGLTRSQALRYIIIPQTIKVVLPAIGNEFIALLKDSSLVSILALTDLMQRGKQYATQSFAYFETFTMVALVYLVLTLFLSRLVGIMEERIHSRGRRQ